MLHMIYAREAKRWVDWDGTDPVLVREIGQSVDLEPAFPEVRMQPQRRGDHGRHALRDRADDGQGGGLRPAHRPAGDIKTPPAAESGLPEALLNGGLGTPAGN